MGLTRTGTRSVEQKDSGLGEARVSLTCRCRRVSHQTHALNKYLGKDEGLGIHWLKLNLIPPLFPPARENPYGSCSSVAEWHQRVIQQPEKQFLQERPSRQVLKRET